MTRRTTSLSSPWRGTTFEESLDLLFAMALLGSGALLIPRGRMTSMRLVAQGYEFDLPAGIVGRAIHEHGAWTAARKERLH
jgi:hypothetical protein